MTTARSMSRNDIASCCVVIVDLSSLAIKVATRTDKHIMPCIGNGRMGMHHAYRRVAPMAGIGRDSGASLNLAIDTVVFHETGKLGAILKRCAEVYRLDRPVLLLDSCEQFPKGRLCLFAKLFHPACLACRSW